MGPGARVVSNGSGALPMKRPSPRVDDPFCGHCRYARSIGVRKFRCGECLEEASMPLCFKCKEHGHPVVQFKLVHVRCKEGHHGEQVEDR
jgi:hypothetical protein